MTPSEKALIYTDASTFDEAFTEFVNDDPKMFVQFLLVFAKFSGLSHVEIYSAFTRVDEVYLQFTHLHGKLAGVQYKIKLLFDGGDHVKVFRSDHTLDSLLYWDTKAEVSVVGAFSIVMTELLFAHVGKFELNNLDDPMEQLSVIDMIKFKRRTEHVLLPQYFSPTTLVIKKHES